VISTQKSMSGKGNVQFPSQVRACHHLASITLEPGGGAGHATLYLVPLTFQQGDKLDGLLIYTYVDSQVSHPRGRKFPFFLTYFSYSGALKACHRGVSISNFP
jgi:hypothetical protein